MKQNETESESPGLPLKSFFLLRDRLSDALLCFVCTAFTLLLSSIFSANSDDGNDIGVKSAHISMTLQQLVYWTEMRIEVIEATMMNLRHRC